LVHKANIGQVFVQFSLNDTGLYIIRLVQFGCLCRKNFFLFGNVCGVDVVAF
jgi:hypothetical protein